MNDRWQRWAALGLHVVAGGAAVAAGVGHSLSIQQKIASGRLGTFTDTAPPVLYVIGAILVAAGAVTVLAGLPLWRSGQARWAQITAVALAAVVLGISLVFMEPRGLPLAIPAAIDGAALFAYGRWRARNYSTTTSTGAASSRTLGS